VVSSHQCRLTFPRNWEKQGRGQRVKFRVNSSKDKTGPMRRRSEAQDTGVYSKSKYR
jgi:hypothetical protein